MTHSWYGTQFNTLINKMKAIPDSGTAGTLLDNSLLMWTSCLSDGASHHSDNMPITLAGSNGGYFRQGKLIRYNDTFTTDATKDSGNPWKTSCALRGLRVLRSQR